MEKNWEYFRKRILIDKPLQEVYECWSTQSKMEIWFLEKAEYKARDRYRDPMEQVQQGDDFTWKWNNWEILEKGQILEANGKDHISFTFGTEGVVHVMLNEKGNSTELVLKQEGIPTDDNSKMEVFVGCITGWTFWLTNLKAYLEHGVTLHAKGLEQDETTDLINS